MSWVGIHGHKVEFRDTPYGMALIEALRALGGADNFSDGEIEGQAELLWSTASYGKDAELPRSRFASQKSTDAELRKFAELCQKLQDHIEKMHRPAVNAMYLEGCALFALLRQVAEAGEAARVAFSSASAPEKVAGAHPKIAAEEVGLQAGLLYHHITGARPTYTSDPFTSEVSGAWPQFLSEVFKATGIKASASAQAKALSQKLGPILAD